MSAHRDTDTEAMVYVRLLDEGTDVWRPVRARRSGCHIGTMLKPHRDAAQVHRPHQDIRDQFRAFGLEMMLQALRDAFDPKICGNRTTPIAPVSGLATVVTGNELPR
jgi:hypothetical protein